VYRADDLRLGQAVALKFLPRGLADDQQRLALFHEEVRLARQVSHPNVCRVYDIGEWQAGDGRPTSVFLSMEFVDGEDLAALLKRIGRLPPDKGVQIAQQLCAGLAAAHEKGVIHRDLKPANIMLDGKGQVRITDFGLARVAQRLEGAEARSGTPMYMSPEQLAGREVTVRSDIYALGLVLYEVFTGSRPFPARSAEEMRRLQEGSAPASPSGLVSDLDPAVEQVILRCLEQAPQDRPKSAHAVAAALPGGDPLAAALAAGETPSPELVAAAGGEGSLTPAVAGTCLAGIVVCLLLVLGLAGQVMLVNRAPLERSPAVLEDRAQETLRHLGYLASGTQPGDSAAGWLDYWSDNLAVRESAPPEGARDAWERLQTGPWPRLRFWYRQGPKPFVVVDFFTETEFSSRNRVSWDLPPWNTQGMVGVMLHPRGNLLYFRAVPPVATVARDTSVPVDRKQWSRWFPAAIVGFDLDALKAAEWRRTPPDACDAIQAWEGAWPESSEKLYVEAAAYRGRPVYFEVLHGGQMEQERRPAAAHSTNPLTLRFRFLEGLLASFFFIVLLSAVALAGWNLRRGRGDRRGAFRLAAAVFLLSLLIWVLLASHATPILELKLFQVALADALLTGGFLWLLYIALEPMVRRFWPQLLISWVRVLQGRWRDPGVGRDLLVGTLTGCAAAVLAQSSIVASVWLELPTGLFRPLSSMLLGPPAVLASVLDSPLIGIGNSIILLVMVLLLRIVLRTERLAAGGAVVLLSTIITLMLPANLLIAWLPATLAAVLIVWLLIRYGLLAAVVQHAVGELLINAPITTNTSAFYFGNGLFVLGVVVAIGLFGFYTSLGRRPLFAETTAVV
jgi:serine/threonine-protein kinase